MMSERVLGYPLAYFHGPHHVAMPKGAKILTIADQAGKPTLWALVGELPLVDKVLWMVGTGWDLPDEMPLEFVGTVFKNGYVWHFFVEVT